MHNSNTTTAIKLYNYIPFKIEDNYKCKFNQCKNIILGNFRNLHDASNYSFYFAYLEVPLNLPAISHLLPRISDSSKAYCNKKTNTIYISNWALRSPTYVLTHILLHELLHINFPQYSEEKIITLTEDYFEKIRDQCQCIGIVL